MACYRDSFTSFYLYVIDFVFCKFCNSFDIFNLLYKYKLYLIYTIHLEIPGFCPLSVCCIVLNFFIVNSVPLCYNLFQYMLLYFVELHNSTYFSIPFYCCVILYYFISF
jgi:hypothetical protein